VDIGLPGDDDPRRADVREWVAAHPKPTGRQLAEAGYVVPHWPAPFGRDADPLTQLVIDEELRAAGVRRPVNPIGIGWAGPTLMYAGTPEQKERWLWPLLSGEEFWCQLFSEPGAGSDLAALSLRAERDGDHYVLNGQKVWTSYAHIAQWGILLARTDATAAKHAGISYFVCPMRSAGIEVRALVDMTGEHAFNEVFFTDVRIPADHLVGAENGGWELAKVTLGNERVSLSGSGALWGMGPTAEDLVELVREWGVVSGRGGGGGAGGGGAGAAGGGAGAANAAGAADIGGASAAGGGVDPVLSDRLASVWTESQILRVLRLRTVSAVLAGRAPGAEASVRKAIADAHGQHVMGLGRDLAGAYGMLQGTGPVGAGAARAGAGSGGGSGGAGAGAGGGATGSTWSRGFLFSPALTVGGGTAEVQRNIVAEKVLGLPRDP
jgi:3-oxochol-4-en-24-oyl-CoA dehydrogenase